MKNILSLALVSVMFLMMSGCGDNVYSPQEEYVAALEKLVVEVGQANDVNEIIKAYEDHETKMKVLRPQLAKMKNDPKYNASEVPKKLIDREKEALNEYRRFRGILIRYLLNERASEVINRFQREVFPEEYKKQ